VAPVLCIGLCVELGIYRPVGLCSRWELAATDQPSLTMDAGPAEPFNCTPDFWYLQSLTIVPYYLPCGCPDGVVHLRLAGCGECLMWILAYKRDRFFVWHRYERDEFENTYRER
jgi:hypothetical protein